MANADFKHLEILPLDEDNLVLSEDTEGNVRSKACLNLSFCISNSLSKLARIIRIAENGVNPQDNSFVDVSYILEVFLASILNVNTISDPAQVDIYEHYRRRQTQVSASKILPSFKYCQDITYAGFKVWGTHYGTLGYYNFLNEDYEEYLSPSELVYYSTLRLIALSRETAYTSLLSLNSPDYRLLVDLYTTYESLIQSNNPDADIDIYNIQKEVITGIPVLADMIASLRFYQDWVPDVFEWYIEQVSNGVNVTLIGKPSTNQERARNTLIRVVQSLLTQGLDEFAFTNLYQSYIRQNIHANLYEALDQITTIRKQSTYLEVNTATQSVEEDLVQRFHGGISLIATNLNFRTGSNLILSAFCPPGGYTLLQVSIAATLINRAYILAYRASTTREEVQGTNTYKRIIKLLGLAGLTLIKTNKPHLQATGVNLMKTFNINLTNIQPNNLLDLA